MLYLEAWGKPVAFYNDKQGVSRVNYSAGQFQPRRGNDRGGELCVAR